MKGGIFSLREVGSGGETVEGLRSRVLNGLLWTAAMMGAFMLALGLVDEFHARPRFGAVAVYAVSYSFVLAAAYFKRLSYRYRGGMFLLALYAIGVTSLAVTGLSSPTSLFLFAFVVFAAMIFGFRVGLFSFVLSTITLGLAAVLSLSEIWAVESISNVQILPWLTSWMSFTCTSAAALVTLTLLLTGLSNSMRSAQALADNLNKEALERNRAEGSLLLKNTVFNESIAANSIADAGGIITEANPSFVKLWGYLSVQAVIGKPISDFLANDEEVALIMESLNSSGQWGGDFTAKRVDGSCFLAHSLATALRDKSGMITGYQSSIVDITERRRALEELRESEQRFRYLADHLPVHIELLDENARPVYYNRALREFCGMSENNPPVDWNELIHPDDRERLSSRQRNAFERQSPVDIEFRMRDTKNEYHWFLAKSMPRFSNDGKYLGLIASAIDITERRQAEQAVRESEEKYRVLVETTSTGFVILDEEGRVLDANDEYVRLSGRRRREEILGRSMVEWTAPHDRERNVEAVKKCLISGSVKGFEVDYAHGDGTEIPVEIDASTLRSDKGLRIVTLCRDISERKQAEKVLFQEKQFSDTVINGQPGIFFVFNSKGFLVRWNENHERLLGYSPAEMRTVNILELITEADRPIVTKGIQEVSEQGHTSLEAHIKPRTGAPILHSICAVRMVVGHESYLVGTGLDISEHKKAENALADERRRLSDILKGTNVGTWEWNVETGETVFNERWAEMLGYTLEELAPVSLDTWIQLTHPEDLRLAQEQLQEHFRGAHDYYVSEMRMRHKDGHWVWILDQGCVHTWNADGTPLKMSGTHQDISERKRAEAKIRFDEERLETLLNLHLMIGESENTLTHFAMEAAVRLTESTIGYIAFANDDESVLTMYAWSNTAMAECAIEDKPIVYPVSQTGLWGEAIRQRKAVITNDYGAPNTLKKGIPEGHVRVGRHMNAPIFDGERIVIVAGVGNKATDYNEDDVRQLTLLMSGLWTIVCRKRAEEELRQNETRLRSLVDILQHPASTIQEMLDYTLDQAIDLTESKIGYIYFYHEDRKEFVLNTWSKDVMKECSIVNPMTCYALDKTGLWGEAVRQRRPIIVNDFEALHPLRKGYPGEHAKLRKFLTIPVFSGERIVATVGLANKESDYTETDVLQVTLLMDSVWKVTERRRSEEEKEHLQAQLLQAKKMESVGRLAGGVAHDFNNMLSVILGHTELAMENLDPSNSLHADLKEVYKAASRSADLTRQLLAFARKQTVAPKILDLNETLEGMLKMLRRLIGEDVELQWNPGENLWTIRMDPAQVDQILANLCLNARDAIAGVGTLAIQTQNVILDDAYCAQHVGATRGEYVLLTVSDNGHGMEHNVLEHLFEPFFTTKALGEGTGLGLATVYGIVEQNKGSIRVQSWPGQGTTFHIYLPRYRGKSGDAQAEGSADAPRRGNETVLLVEDEVAILELSRRLLLRLGYEVLAASTPVEAIQLAQEYSGEIHLLMTDVVMPEMNGRELAKQILRLYPTIRILFMSGYTADVIAHRGILEDGVCFIQKPFTLKRLAAKVREAFDPE